MAETVKTAKAPAKPRKAPAKKSVNHAGEPEQQTATQAKAPAKPRKVAAKGNGKASETLEMRSVSHDDVARLAHSYWAERGFKHGHHEEDWLRAEEELRGKAS